ncbi:MAG: ABC transporter permease [Bacteroidetes bacterium]|nr:ABC transporter permease [Bacteroidota bacterium]
MIRQLLQLTSIHFKEFYRNPGIIFWAIAFPVLMAWGLGIAFTKQDELLRHVALVEDNNSMNKEFRAFLESSRMEDQDKLVLQLGDERLGIIRYEVIKGDWEGSLQLLKKGKVSMIIKEEKDSMQYHLDPINPEGQLVYMQITSAINNKNLEKGKEVIKPLTQVGTRYIDFLIPGLMGMGIMMSCMWGMSYPIIDKRAKKLLRRMVATPMKKSLFLLSQFISRLSLSLMESILLFIFAWWYFDVSIQGSVLAVLLVFIAANMAFTGIAVLMSSRTDNPQVGNGLINLVVMPMMIMSGIFFSYHNFPEWAIPVIQLFPLTVVADSIRGIFIEGLGVMDIMNDLFVLSGIGVVFFFSGLRIFKWY